MPVGRVVGRIEAGDPRAVGGLAVRVRTDPDPAGDVGKLGGFASAVTDDQGRFTIPQIAAGTLALSVEYRWDLPWRRPAPAGCRSEPGTTTEVAIPLQRAGLVKGVVQEAPSGQPLAGVGVGVAPIRRSPGPQRCRGSILAYAFAPGRLFANPSHLPRGYYNTSGTIAGTRRLLPEGTAELTWSRSGCAGASSFRARPRRGRKAGAGGGCRRSLVLANGSFGRNINTVTDRQGRFRITGLPPTRRLHLSAARGEATTAAPVPVPASKGTIDLTIRPENAVALVGRVKDPAGRPVAGAAVRVSARKRSPDDIPVEQFTVAFDDEGRTILRTGADGQFRTPRRLRPDLEYRVDVEADGYIPAGTEWIQPGDRKLWYFPAMTLQPATTTRTVAGRVVDAGPADRRRRRVPVGRRAGAYPHHHRR